MAIYQCKEAFVYWVGAAPVVVSHGDLVSDAKDPRYRGHEDQWELVEEKAARQATSVVEAATAAPGERRAFKPKG